MRILVTILLTILPMTCAFSLENEDDRFGEWVKLANMPTKQRAQHQGRLERLRLDDADGLKLFVDSISSDDVRARRAASLGIRLIGELDKDEATLALLKAIEDSDSMVRRNAIFGIADFQTSPKKCVPALIKLIDNADSESAYAATALSKFGADAKSAASALINLTKHNSNSTRRSAAAALGEIGVADSETVAALQGLWKDSSVDVQRAAAFASWKIEKSDNATDHLIKLLDANPAHDEYFGINTIEVLGDIGPQAKDALPKLTEIGSKTDNPYEKPMAIWAVHRINGKRAPIDKFRKMLVSEDELERMGAVRALLKSGSSATAAIPDLRKILYDPNEDGFMPMFAAEAIRRIEEASHKDAKE